MNTKGDGVVPRSRSKGGEGRGVSASSTGGDTSGETIHPLRRSVDGDGGGVGANGIGTGTKSHR